MSTRARITITDGENELNFYRHSDGYPSGVMPTLGHFMKRVKNGQIRDDLMQAAGWLIAFGINEYRNYGYTGDLEPGPAGSSMGWKVGAYEPDPYPLHGDEEFIYILNLKDKTIEMMVPGEESVYMKGWSPEYQCKVGLDCPVCGRKPQMKFLKINRSVTSTNGEDIYFVARDEDGNWSCTCPDHVHRQHDCKHIDLIKLNS